jgi:hypothetical protein
VYWLGASVELPGSITLVPGVAEFGDAADAEHLSYSYDSEEPLGPSLTFDVYAAAGWSIARAERLRQPPMRIDKASVAGRPAEVWVSSTSRGPVNHIDVVVDYGDTVVIVGTTALPQYDRTPEFNVPLNTYIARMKTPSAMPLPDLNPLIDEQTFLSALQQLRPYPQ